MRIKISFFFLILSSFAFENLSAQAEFYPYFRSFPNMPQELIIAKSSPVMRKRSECKLLLMDTICKDTQNSRGEKEKIIRIYQCCIRKKDTLRTIFASISHNPNYQDTTFYNLAGYAILNIVQSQKSRFVTVYPLQFDTCFLQGSQSVENGAFIVERHNFSEYEISPSKKLQLVDTLAWKDNICSVAHFYPNGQLAYKGQYSNQFDLDSFPIPMRIGRWEYYRENGQLDTVYNYDKPIRRVRIVPRKRH